ncbi:unnamed protein product [Cercospora beticola]|nr:unnamed protein product [Cercospora beticola]
MRESWAIRAQRATPATSREFCCDDRRSTTQYLLTPVEASLSATRRLSIVACSGKRTWTRAAASRESRLPFDGAPGHGAEKAFKYQQPGHAATIALLQASTAEHGVQIYRARMTQWSVASSSLPQFASTSTTMSD